MNDQNEKPMTAPGTPARSLRADGAKTRARIIESAGQLFGSQGFAETTSKAVARRAKVDLASINYHFGNRDGLYKAVLAEAHRRLIHLDELREIAATPLSAPEKLRQIFKILVARSLGPTGWNAHVLAREILSPSSHLDVLFETELPPKFRVLAGIFSEISGIPQDEPALIRCAISAGAPCAVLFVVSRTQNPVACQIAGLPESELVDHLQTFAIGGLKAIGQEYRNRKATRA
jgi:AcrR family transcriptional regulator